MQSFKEHLIVKSKITEALYRKWFKPNLKLTLFENGKNVSGLLKTSPTWNCYYFHSTWLKIATTTSTQCNLEHKHMKIY